MVKGAEEAMDAFKMEIANDLGFGDKINDNPDGFKKLTTEEVGLIGGEMVRRVQAAGEFAIMQRYKQHEQRLMPEDVLPAVKDIRAITNNGNKTV
jgi:hypothetical protein